MKMHCQRNLEELVVLAKQLSNEQYTSGLRFLSGASIGQHFRHIIELYQCLLKGIEHDEVNYDSRVRDTSIETSVEKAVSCISKIQLEIGEILNNKVVTLKGNYACEKEGEINIITSIYRELAYNLEHSIHHQALIKVALMELGCETMISETFGVAPSTVRYRSEMVNQA